MNALTAKELRIFNGLSRVHDSGIKLGDTIAQLIGAVGETGTPVNAIRAKETFIIDGVAIHGETLTIDNPAWPGINVYEFLADDAQTKTVSTNIAVDLTAVTTKASGTLTVPTQPTSGDTITIGAKTYIFVPVGTANADGEISIGADVAGAQVNIVAAVNGTDEFNTAHPNVSAGDFITDDCTITAFIGGTAGDAIATTHTFTGGGNVFVEGTLGSGADCTADDIAATLITTINGSWSEGVNASEGTGTNVVFTADIAGVIGNAISIGTTMANGVMTAEATELSGGIDGTVAEGTKFMVDETYVYVCLSGNTTAGTNWRRVDLGSVYY